MANWAGDQNVDWTDADGLKSSIIAALSLGKVHYIKNILKNYNENNNS